jgi:hypothetical protein
MNDIPGIGHNAPSDLDLLLADAQRNAEEAAQCPEELDAISAPTATDMVKILTRLDDKLDRARKAEQAPHAETVKEIAKRCEPLLSAMAAAKAIILTRLHRYRTNNKIEEVDGSFAKAHGVSRQKFKVVDADQIPRKFLVPDMKAIADAWNNGTVIPGVRAFYVDSTQVR